MQGDALQLGPVVVHVLHRLKAEGELREGGHARRQHGEHVARETVGGVQQQGGLAHKQVLLLTDKGTHSVQVC